MLGISEEIILVSDTKMMSDFNKSLCSLQKSSSEGDPISSSPSKRNFTFTFSKLFFAKNSNAFTWIKDCPLSSSAPRPQI